MTFYSAPGLKKPKEITTTSLIESAAKKYGVTVDEILSRARVQPIAEARSYAIYLVREHMHLSQTAIGKIFKRDHATILYSCKVIKDRIKFNQLLIK